MMAPEVRKIFEKHDGNLGATGCVAWMFDRKGLFVISKDAVSEERLMEIALTAGADDISVSGDEYEVTCDPDSFSDLRQTLEDAEIEVVSAQVTRIPQNTVELDVETARVVLSLVEILDDHDDIQGVSANFDIPDEAMAELAADP